MLRSLLLVFALVFSSTTFAAQEWDDLFTPVEGDYSIYIIGKIFGDVEESILPGGSTSGPQLFGNVFRIFNLVALALGVLMVIYTLVLAVLNTAHHGKMMGEKMSSMWVPVRIAFAIAMLIPKANGYCLAQVCVMWLVVQGVGAADTVWNTALDYFEKGGAIGGQQLSPTDINESGLNGVYDNLLDGVMRAGTCVATHNVNQSNLQEPYDIYTVVSGNYYYVNFGAPPAANEQTGEDDKGFECGRIKLNHWQASHFGNDQDLANQANAFQMMVVYDFATAIYRSIGYPIAHDIIEEGQDFTHEYETMKSESLSYVTDMTSDQTMFVPPETVVDDSIAIMRDQGWITAGNYYQVLTQLQASYFFVPDSTNTPSVEESYIHPTENEETDLASKIYDGFMKWEGRYYSEQISPAQQARDAIEHAADTSEIFKQVGYVTALKNMTGWFIETISGSSGSTDPVLNAAVYGRKLMVSASSILVGLAVGFPVIAYAMGLIPFITSGVSWTLGVLFTVGPIIFSAMAFMYTQGAALGIYLPIVPFIIFAIAAIGWILSVIEAMVAAPLVALGMTLPEGHEIYGRAEPAYMMLINLFLRPALTILGLIGAMLAAWLVVELVNLSFYSAVMVGGLKADPLFGPFVVGVMYSGILVVVITKVFGLINLVPDRVLRWIGDNTQAVGGAEEALGAAKQAEQEGASQTSNLGKEGAMVGRSQTGAAGEQGMEHSKQAGFEEAAVKKAGQEAQGASGSEADNKAGQDKKQQALDQKRQGFQNMGNRGRHH